MRAIRKGVVAVMMVACAFFAGAWKPAEAESGDAHEVADKLTGTWRLVSVETIRPNGEILTEWMGEKPSGLIVYLPNGRMSVQIMRDPRPRFENGSRLRATPDELKAAYLGYYAYWGSYSISASDKMIVHSVEGSLWPEEVGITYKRYFALDGSKLILTTAPYKRGEEERRNRLVWERVP